MQKYAENHKSKIRIIEAGSTYAVLAKQLGGNLVEITADRMSVKKY